MKLVAPSLNSTKKMKRILLQVQLRVWMISMRTRLLLQSCRTSFTKIDLASNFHFQEITSILGMELILKLGNSNQLD